MRRCREPQYGPGVLAAAAELTCTHYLPVGRAAALLATLAGIGVSVGFVAGVRGRASCSGGWACCTSTRCGAHLLRDLAAYHRADPDQQIWAKARSEEHTSELQSH